MIKLYNLIPNEIKEKQYISNVFIKGISCDSRKIKKNYIFAALVGSSNNGIDFISDAINKGAVVIIVDSKKLKYIKNNFNIEVISSEQPRKLYALICNKFSQYKFKNLVGVTGTNGKTSVAWYVHQISKLFGEKTASIGTLGTIYKTIDKNNNLTTPESEVLVSNLNKLSAKNVKNVIIEASSHGLDQFRLDGINFNIVAITSLSRDHLDYHKNFKNYKNAKIRLFSDLTRNGIAIINDNIKYSNEFIKAAIKNQLKVITIGKSSNSNFKYKIINLTNRVQEIEITYSKKKSTIYTGIIGDFQINNLITAICIMIEMGFKRKEIEKFTKKIKPPPGRLEFINSINGADIYIDYAHTPDALKNVLLSLRPYVKNKLYLVFGCGGDRDKGKRVLMGKVSYKYADIIIITDDNPRFEDPNEIRKQIIQYCPAAIEIGDRKKAIKNALFKLIRGDILVIAGKGHENTQEIMGSYLNFDDAKIIKNLIKKDSILGI
jgi:UDP-N-acetylmuramoyl-L-alanyl-D-glutamate--2,6-diaminopimelate ligase